MFDSITCNYPLPDTGYKIPHGHDGWQTKDLDNYLGRFIITEEGRLLRVVAKREWVDSPGIMTGDGEEILRGHLERVSDEWRDEEYEGDIVFYDVVTQPEGSRVWAEFAARFKGGTLSEVHKVDVHEMQPFKKREVD